MSLGKLDTPGDKGVLGRTVDEGDSLKNRSHGKDGRGRNFLVRRLDSSEQVVGRVIDTRDDVGVSLGVGGPQDDDIVELIVLFEVSDIGPDVVQVGLLVIAGNQIVSPVSLVGCDEVGVYRSVQIHHIEIVDSQ